MSYKSHQTANTLFHSQITSSGTWKRLGVYFWITQRW